MSFITGKSSKELLKLRTETLLQYCMKNDTCDIPVYGTGATIRRIRKLIKERSMLIRKSWPKYVVKCRYSIIGAIEGDTDCVLCNIEDIYPMTKEDEKDPDFKDKVCTLDDCTLLDGTQKQGYDECPDEEFI